MFNKPLLSAELYDDFAKVTYNNSVGIQDTKHISVESFTNLFSEVEIKSPIFPLWTVAYAENNSIMKMITCRNTDMLTVPMRNRNSDTDFEISLHIPYIYFIWTINKSNNKYSLANASIFSSFAHPAEKTVTAIPYIPNTYPDGRICWGSNNIFKAESSLNVIRQAENTFFIGVHNYDTTARDTTERISGVRYHDQEEWLDSSVVHKPCNRQTLQQIISQKLWDF